jgi:hypothetical protein
MSEDDRVRALLEAEAAAPASVELEALVAAAMKRHGGVKAVLFYGSCLRDGLSPERMADLYLVVESYRRAHRNPLSALANYLLPPNVYYLEADQGGRTYRAKYAVVSLEQLRRRVGAWAFIPYFWARFSQPTAIAWSDGPDSRRACLDILERAQRRMLAAALPTVLAETPDQLWLHALKQTYATELRAETAGRAAEILQNDRERYEISGAAFLERMEGRPRLPAWCASALWTLRRILGKSLTVLRLVKAAFTFTGGANYLAWKLERHSGVPVKLTPWQKRHPILAGLPMAIRLYRRGAIR